ncbi:ATPase, P-type (transporting), HAD superfamily, subfamily IC [Ruaniaceae bacterium KH17]|nr:ATPase, P-type (transporting), HAD superfamily, subfamily IC [Ruaniaceae bacterium KH17]
MNETDPSLSSADDVAHHHGVDPEQGLSSAEAATRLETHGPNELRASDREPAWKRFAKQFADPLVYLLLVAIVISIVAWVLEGAAGVPIDAIVILVIVLANAIIGYVQENKAADAVAALADMTAAHATVLRDGRLTDVPSSELVPGDILVLAEGDAVSADARLISASSLYVQESSLTGESEAVLKNPGTLDSAVGVGDRTNMVFSGTGVTRGVGRAVVTGTGMATEMGKIATLLDSTEREPSPLNVEIAKISRTLGLLVILIAIGVMAVLAIVNGVSSAEEAVDILLLGVSLAVAAVPEGLPAILSLVLAIGVQAMAKRNAVMKNLESVETLGSVSVICSDKTGTLTKNEMTLREIVTASGRVTLTGTGYDPVGEASATGSDTRTALGEAQVVLAAGALANNAQLDRVDGQWQIQGDPTEAAFLVAARKLEGVTAITDPVERQAEAPFDSDRKMMSILSKNAEGITRVLSKGAPDVLLDRCVREQVGRDRPELTPARREEIQRTIVELSENGYRTLGVAWREAPEETPESFDEDDERDLVFGGIVAIIDPPRQEAADAIAVAHDAGIATVMITGDHPVTAARIASDLGIVENGREVHAMTGAELEGMSDEQLAEVVQTTRVYARVSPEHKLRIVNALQANQRIVAMTGDGVNDAPALRTADIGIAMGITGTEVTKEAAEMILGDDNYATIIAAVQRGRVIFDNIKKFIRYLLSSNMGEVATVFLAVILGGVIGLADPANPGAAVVPLLATQILWINLVTDSGPALAMGVDPQIDDVMARQPRKISDRIIDGRMWSRIIGVGLVMGILALVVYDLNLPGGLIGGMEHLSPTETQFDVARTTMFTALVFMQLFNALNSRSDTASAFSHLFTNRWLWASFAFVIIAQIAVVELPFLQSAFGTTSITAAHWALAVGAGAAVLVVEEIVKAIRRRI